MAITIDSDAMAAVASAAIFDSLSEEARADILKQAVEYLITPVKPAGSWSGTAAKSPLQEAFERSLQAAAYRAVEEKIKNDPQVAKQIDDLLGPVISGAIDANAENYDDTLGHEIGRAVGAWLNDRARERNR